MLKKYMWMIPVLLTFLLASCASDGAPPAPEEHPVPTGEYVTRPARPVEKHGPQGAATPHTVSTTPWYSDIGWCGAPRNTTCIVQANNTWSGDAQYNDTDRIRSIKTVSWSYGWDGIDRWSTYSAGLVSLVVTDATGASWWFDITNAQSSLNATPPYRRGSFNVSGSGIEQWPGEWLMLEIVFMLRWTTNPTPPKYGVNAHVGSFTFTDGP